MTALKPETVKSTVMVWNIIFSGQKSEAELAVIGAKFHQSLHTVYGDESFRKAAELVEREVGFFPTIKDMMSVRNSANQIVERDAISNYAVKALPEETDNLTPEEIEINLKKIQIIKRMLCGEITVAQAEKEQSELTHFAR